MMTQTNNTEENNLNCSKCKHNLDTHTRNEYSGKWHCGADGCKCSKYKQKEEEK